MGGDKTEGEGLALVNTPVLQTIRDAKAGKVPGIYWTGGPLFDLLQRCAREIERLQAWVNDLQSGMYINCVYCGHRYGPSDEVPAAMADVLTEHVEQCPEHPMSALQHRVDEQARKIERLREALAKILSCPSCINEVSLMRDVARAALDTDKGAAG